MGWQTNIATFGPSLIGVEMEAGGVASAAFQAASRPGFFMVRGVSDVADPDKDARGRTDGAHMRAMLPPLTPLHS